MNKIAAIGMTVVGVGLMVWAASDFVPSGDYSGWSESCRYVMTAGAMLATGGRLIA